MKRFDNTQSVRLIGSHLAVFGGVLLAASACAHGLVVVGGKTSSPTRIINGDGVEIFSGGGARDFAPTTTGSNPANSPLEQAAPTVDKRSGGASSLVSPRLTALPGQAAVVRAVDPRRADARSLDDGRIEILTQELTRESKDLINKQRLLRLPAGRDQLADELRGRIKEEVRQHEQNIVGLHREINLVVQEQQRRARDKL